LTAPESIEQYARALADGIEEALSGWVLRCVARVMEAAGRSIDPETERAAARAAGQARAETGSAVRALLEADIDEQRSTPLTLLRQAVRYPTRVLHAAGVPTVERDRFATAAFPADDYDLSPASWSDIDPALADLGLTWSAAKAFEHKRRHRPPTA
jgi:hypothetical protein